MRQDQMKRKRLRFIIPISFVLFCTLILSSCGGTDNQSSYKDQADLDGVKQYLLQKSGTLTGHTTSFKDAAARYYTLAQAANFDYKQLIASKAQDVRSALTDARNAWKEASPAYEEMEGIVAGVPVLSEYDVILDAGVSAEEGGEDVVPFDLTLPDGTVLKKPGNLFSITETTLWGTAEKYAVRGQIFDVDGNGRQDFGDILPDPQILKASADALDHYSRELQNSGQQWKPTLSDTFTALVSNVPTVKDFFDSWKTSRFVAGDKATEGEFSVISRLSDIISNVESWQTMYNGVSPVAKESDADQDRQITTGLSDLKTYVENLEKQEQGGKRFTAEEAELLGDEAQGRANTITGQITQMAARLNVRISQA